MQIKERLFEIFNNTKLKSFIPMFINIFLVLFAINTISLNFFPTGIQLMYLSTVFILIYLLFNIPFKKLYTILFIKRPHRSDFVKAVFGLFLIFISFLIFLFTNLQLIWIAGISLMLSGLYLCLKGLGINKRELYALSLGTFFYSLFYLLVFTIPIFWNLSQKISLGLSSFAGVLFGPSVSGFWILITIIIFSTILFFTYKIKKFYIFVNFLILILFWIAYIFFKSFIGISSKIYAVNHHLFFFILCLVPLMYFIYKKGSFEEIKTIGKSKEIAIKSLFTNATILAIILLLLSTIFLVTFIPHDFQDENDKVILFYGFNTLGTFDVPDYEKFGEHSFGYFGLLPIYLTQAGYTCKILVNDTSYFMNVNYPQLSNENLTRYFNITDYVELIQCSVVTEELLNSCDVFVVSHLTVSFSKQELETIWNFVESGGGLLVLGDHTNVGNIQQPTNNLLDTIGISLRFDSAIPTSYDSKFETGYQLFHHSSLNNVQDLTQLKISIGGSLDISYTSYPTIIGRYFLSDAGLEESEEMAYLGDYEYQKGEQIGDVILAACTHYGNGRVYVFGDASTFQGFSVAYSYPVFNNIFDWLDGRDNSPYENIFKIIGIIILFASVIIYFLFNKQKNKKNIFVMLPLFLCLALIISLGFNQVIINDKIIEGNVAVIDASHVEIFNLRYFKDNSLTGFMLNLLRNNHLPIILMDFSENQISKSKMIIFNAPTKMITAEEVNFLKQYMYDGGFVILATGFEEKAASNILLDEFNLDIYDIPLGPVPYVEENITKYFNETRFVSAWPIKIIDGKNTEIVYEAKILGKNYTFITFTRYGKGGLLLISDSEFLYDKNIENNFEFWPGNLITIKTILNNLETKGVSS